MCNLVIAIAIVGILFDGIQPWVSKQIQFMVDVYFRPATAEPDLPLVSRKVELQPAGKKAAINTCFRSQFLG